MNKVRKFLLASCCIVSVAAGIDTAKASFQASVSTDANFQNMSNNSGFPQGNNPGQYNMLNQNNMLNQSQYNIPGGSNNFPQSPYPLGGGMPGINNPTGTDLTQSPYPLWAGVNPPLPNGSMTGQPPCMLGSSMIMNNFDQNPSGGMKWIQIVDSIEFINIIENTSKESPFKTLNKISFPVIFIPGMPSFSYEDKPYNYDKKAENFVKGLIIKATQVEGLEKVLSCLKGKTALDNYSMICLIEAAVYANNQKVKEENDRLVTQLKKENEALEREKKALERHANNLKEDNKKKEDQNKEKEDQIKCMQSNFSNAKNEWENKNQQLTHENQQLTDENQRLIAKSNKDAQTIDSVLKILREIK